MTPFFIISKREQAPLQLAATASITHRSLKKRHKMEATVVEDEEIAPIHRSSQRMSFVWYMARM